MLKVCLVNFHHNWGGAERVALEVSAAAQNVGETTLVTSARGQLSDRANAVRICSLLGQKIAFSTPQEKLVAFVRFGIALRRFVHEKKFEVVYLNNQVGIFLSVFLIGLGCRVIGHDHTFQRRAARRLIYNLVIRLCLDRIIFVSQALLNRNLIGRLEKAVVIYNGFDFGVSPKIQLHGERVLVMPAMMRNWKGHGILISAIEGLRIRGRAVRCVMIGGATTPEEKTYKEQLQARVKAANLSDQIFFTGYIENVPEYIGRLPAVLVQPSTLADPLPTTLVEGCFLGMPLIGSAIGGIIEIIEDGKNGYLFAPADVTALMESLEQVLDQSDAERQKMSDFSRSKFERDFSAPAFQNKIMEELLRC